MSTAFTALTDDGATLAGESSGEGPAVVLLHGLTATRRYVVMGSTALERSGHRVIGYDARGHGESTRGADGFGYPRLAADLLTVLDTCGVASATLAGASMGAHTLLAFALAHPDRVDGMVVITPAYDGTDEVSRRWDRLAAGLRQGGVDGFLAAYDFDHLTPRLRPTIETVIRQRMARHRDLEAVADALEQVPRSRPFGPLSELARLTVPTAVIASGDEADPEHPQAVAETYAEIIPNVRLVLDRPGASPVAWQGSQVSRVIAEVMGPPV